MSSFEYLRWLNSRKRATFAVSLHHFKTEGSLTPTSAYDPFGISAENSVDLIDGNFGFEVDVTPGHPLQKVAEQFNIDWSNGVKSALALLNPCELAKVDRSGSFDPRIGVESAEISNRIERSYSLFIQKNLSASVTNIRRKWSNSGTMTRLSTIGATPNFLNGIGRHFDVLDDSPARYPVINAYHNYVTFLNSL